MSTGIRAEQERRRHLAVQRVEEGYSQEEVASFLGVSPSAVSQWMKAFRNGGAAALAAKPASGRPPKLTLKQEAEVLSWFTRSPTEFGFRNELWTAPRVAEVIRKTWGIKFHPRYLNHWLAERRITPQKPARQARERDEAAVRHWKRYRWPRLKNERERSARISF